MVFEVVMTSLRAHAIYRLMLVFSIVSKDNWLNQTKCTGKWLWGSKTNLDHVDLKSWVMWYFCSAFLLLGYFCSNLLGRKVVEVVVGEGLAPCEDVVAWEEWDVPLHTCEMVEWTMTGGQACLLHPAWGMATMTAMIGDMTATTHHVVDHHQSCLHVTGELSVLYILLIKLFY